MMKRPASIVGAALVVVAVAAAGALLTRPPETAPPRAAKVSKAGPAGVPTPATSPEAPIVVPEATAPPEPTSADFVQATPAPTAAPPTTAASTDAAAAAPAGSVDWAALPIDELRAKSNAEDITAMEEMARRLMQGGGVPKDQQAGAGWLLRAAQRGSAQAAFNVGVMHERGFVVERDSTRAIEWYRKAVEANLPMAKHNLALLLREGRGAPRNVPEAIELLRSASRQGMAASMFALGDIYERGDSGQKDPSMALAWYAITAEFERQTNRTTESALGKTAAQRVQTLQRVLMPGELERAQQLGQSEFKQIVEALQPPKLPTLPSHAPTPAEAAVPPPATDSDRPGWPKAVEDQIRVIQQALVELKFLRDKPDGVIGPLTRAAIRTFQASVALRETGEPTKDVFVALQEALARRDTTAIDLGKPEPPPEPPTSADFAGTPAKPN